MSKRFNLSQSNTLFNYFNKSISEESASPPKVAKTAIVDKKRVRDSDSDDDLPIKAHIKKSNVLGSSNIKTTPTTPKSSKKNVAQTTPKSISKELVKTTPKSTNKRLAQTTPKSTNKQQLAQTTPKSSTKELFQQKSKNVIQGEESPTHVKKNNETFAEKLEQYKYKKPDPLLEKSDFQYTADDLSLADCFLANAPKYNAFGEIQIEWAHDTYSFLQPDNIKDANMKRPSHPDYDMHTLHVPDEFLNRQTPAMRQWWVLKSTHMDTVLFFKVGKFYELYHMDATVGVKVLGFVYMKGLFAHAGFPESAYGKMIEQLIHAGYKVARVEQTETPDLMSERLKKQSKVTKFDKVCKREICQITAKGICTYGAQTFDRCDAQNDYMLAICESVTNNKKQFGICFIDTSVGVFNLGQFIDDVHCSRLLALISEHPPALLLTEKGRLSNDTINVLEKCVGNIRWDKLKPGKQFYSADNATTILKTGRYFNKTPDNDATFEWPPIFKQLLEYELPKSEYELLMQSLGACIWYLQDSFLDLQILTMKKFQMYLPVDTVGDSGRKCEYMVLDAITKHNLKLLGKAGTLEKTIDYCSTSFGKRLLRQWICRPLCNVEVIKERQLAIAELRDLCEVLNRTRVMFKNLPDIERQIPKIHAYGNKLCAVSHPDSRAIMYENKKYSKRRIKDFVKTLRAYERLVEVTDLYKDCESVLLKKLTHLEPEGVYVDLSDRLKYFRESFDYKKAIELGEISPEEGEDEAYDEAMQSIDDIKMKASQYLAKQSILFKCEIKYFGQDKKRFQLEVPVKQSSLAGDEYTLVGMRKGNNGVRRFTTPYSLRLAEEIVKAEKVRETIVFSLTMKIFEKFDTNFEEWEKVVFCVTRLDVLCSLAEYALNNENMCMPVVHPFADKTFSNIRDGKHPCLASRINYVANSTDLGHDQSSILLITGPNMGGKSTLMRQIAQLTILAQMGSYVPASMFEFTLVDRIFTRMGAYDNIFQSQSTFFVEMSEAGSILQHATRHSLALLDELGRGTTTHDGAAIATAYVQKLTEIKCRTLFTTHYHSLVDYFRFRQDVQLGYMACLVENEKDAVKEKVIFLYSLANGICPKSYGFNVARLAGMPPKIVAKARAVGGKIEQTHNNRLAFMKILKADPDMIRKIYQSLMNN